MIIKKISNSCWGWEFNLCAFSVQTKICSSLRVSNIVNEERCQWIFCFYVLWSERFTIYHNKKYFLYASTLGKLHVPQKIVKGYSALPLADIFTLIKLLFICIVFSIFQPMEWISFVRKTPIHKCFPEGFHLLSLNPEEARKKKKFNERGSLSDGGRRMTQHPAACFVFVG